METTRKVNHRFDGRQREEFKIPIDHLLLLPNYLCLDVPNHKDENTEKLWVIQIQMTKIQMLELIL